MRGQRLFRLQLSNNFEEKSEEIEEIEKAIEKQEQLFKSKKVRALVPLGVRSTLYFYKKLPQL